MRAGSTSRPRAFPVLRRAFALRARRFRRDDSGQALLAGGILSLALILFATSVFPVGAAVQRRIRAQNAADAAAAATGAWAARGCNLIAACNALSWDLHAIYHLVINGVTIRWVGQLTADICDPPAGWVKLPVDWLKGRKQIGNCWDALSYIFDYTSAGRVAVTPGYNHIALAEASEIARVMGADKIGKGEMEAIFSSLGLPQPSDGYDTIKDQLDEWYGTGTWAGSSVKEILSSIAEIVPVLGKIISGIIGLFPDPSEKIDLYCWPLAPDVQPHKAYEITRSVTWPSVFGRDRLPPEAGVPPVLSSSPLHTTWYDPFLLDLLFVKFFNWNDEYSRLAGEIDGNKPDLSKEGIRFTTAVRFQGTEKEKSWFPSLAKLWFGGENAVTAVSSVKVKGDRLTDAGPSGTRIYFSMGILALPIWPIPIVHLASCGGNFNYAFCPVAFRESWEAGETMADAKCLVWH